MYVTIFNEYMEQNTRLQFIHYKNCLKNYSLHYTLINMKKVIWKYMKTICTFIRILSGTVPRPTVYTCKLMSTSNAICKFAQNLIIEVEHSKGKLCTGLPLETQSVYDMFKTS